MASGRRAAIRRYKIGETVQVSERDYTFGNDPNGKTAISLNKYKVIEDYPLFVICERKAKFGNATIRTSFLKWDLEHCVA